MGTVTTLRMKAVQAVLRRVMEHHIAFNRHLGLKVESFDPAAPKLRFDMKPELVGNPMRQILHGGVISAVLDVAGGLRDHAVDRRRRRDHRGQVPEHGHHRPARGLPAPGARQALHRHRAHRAQGSRIAVTHMELHNDEGKLIATGGAAYVVG